MTAEGRYEEAESCLIDGYARLRVLRGEHSTYTRDAKCRLYELYKVWGRSEDAAALESPAPDPPASVPP